MPDTSLIHADIFFFVSTIALILISAGIIVAFVYVIAILKNVREMTDKGREEWSEIVADSRRFRASLRDEGGKVKNVLDLAYGVFDKAHGAVDHIVNSFSSKKSKAKKTSAKVK